MRKFDYKKFIKKTIIRVAGKAVDMAILVGIGSALGLHLVRGF